MMRGHRVLIRAALGIILLAVISHTRADPDLWGHVRFGQDIVSTHSIPQIDSYSFTADRAWINHEWLAECAMAIAYAVGGGPGLVALKVLVVFAALWLVWSGLKAQAVDVGSRDFLVALAAIGIFPQINHVRPQIFSVLAFAVLIWILVRPGAARRLLLIPLLFAAWVNLHGGWIVGGGVLALWTGLTLLSSLSERRRESALLFAAGFMALAGTLANPYGWRMWQFLLATVGFGRAEITDWQPLYRLGTGFVALWAVLMIAAVFGAVHALCSRPWDLRRLVVVAVLAVGSFQVSRLEAFFAIAVVLLLGPNIAASLNARRAALTASSAAPRGVAAASAMVIAAALIVGGVAVSASNVTCVRMAEDQSEPEIVEMVKQHGLRGRLLVWFDWGEYAIWHFAPDVQVSIDGRRETVYTDSVMQKHLNFYYVPSSRGAFLSETVPDHIWLPVNLPDVSSLVATGWTPLYRGPRSIWLSRDAPSSQAPPLSELTGMARRCFPGP